MLQEVDINDYDKMTDIVNRHIKRCNSQSRTSAEYGLANIRFAKSQGTGGIWTDNLDDPSCYLIATKVRLSIFNEAACMINCLYVDDESDKKSLKKVKKMIKTATTWATHVGCNTIYVSSWIFKGAEDKQSLWDKLEFEPQEILNVKFI